MRSVGVVQPSMVQRWLSRALTAFANLRCFQRSRFGLRVAFGLRRWVGQRVWLLMVPQTVQVCCMSLPLLVGEGVACPVVVGRRLGRGSRCAQGRRGYVAGLRVHRHCGGGHDHAVARRHYVCSWSKVRGEQDSGARNGPSFSLRRQPVHRLHAVSTPYRSVGLVSRVARQIQPSEEREGLPRSGPFGTGVAPGVEEKEEGHQAEVRAR